MLYLRPPFHIIRGVAVFPDHEQEDVFHYAPAAPHLTMRTDEQTGDKVPVFQLLKYRDDAGSGGFLNFAVDLSIDDEVMEEVASDLRGLMNLRDKPKMSPIFFEDGDVQLMILGAGSNSDEDAPPAAPDADPDAGRFVKAIHHSKPSLYGDNNAIFSVELDEDGVQLMEAAMQGQHSGIGVIYALHFFALRPAYNVKVTVDWDRVQTHFEETFSGRALILTTDVSTVVDELIEDRVINIEVDTFLSEAHAGGAWIGNRDRAITEFKEMITESFFTPVTPPGRKKEDTWNKVTDTAESVGLLLATGGWSGVASLKYTKIDQTQIDRKTMNLTMSERVTMRKSIYPQDVLEGMLAMKDAQGNPLDLSRFVTDVTLDSPWFERRRVTAHALADFDRENIASMTFEMLYDGTRKSDRLTGQEPEKALDWPSRIIDGKMDMPVSYSYTVNFQNVDVAERPGKITSPEMVVTSESVEIGPQNDELYFQDRIVIGTFNFPWDRFSAIEVHLRYDDPDNGIALSDSFMLRQGTPEITWDRFRMDRAKSAYEMRVIYRGTDGRMREQPWREIDEERVTLSDPMPQNLSVIVAPAVDWNEVSMILIELSYTDTVNNLTKTQAMTFLGATTEGQAPQTFSVNLEDRTKRFVSYRGTIVMKDGTQVSIPPSETQTAFLTVSTDMKGHRVMEITGPDGDFAANNMRRIELELSFDDPEHGLASADKLVFDGPGQTKYFEFDYAREDTRAVSLTRTDIFSNGMQNRRDLGETTETRLVLDFA